MYATEIPARSRVYVHMSILMLILQLIVMLILILKLIPILEGHSHYLPNSHSKLEALVMLIRIKK